MHQDHQTPAFNTERTRVYYINEKMAENFQDYLARNKTRLAPLEPMRAPEYYELAEVKKRIQLAKEDRKNLKGISLACTPTDSFTVIGSINFTNFVFGAFQACHLGFSIDKDFEGKGIMREMLTHALRHIRAEYGFHRVMANYLPTNTRSKSLLERLGFTEEGYAKSYLKINGVWQDHILTSFIFDEQE